LIRGFFHGYAGFQPAKQAAGLRTAASFLTATTVLAAMTVHCARKPNLVSNQDALRAPTWF
jgi:hypothetical protein